MAWESAFLTKLEGDDDAGGPGDHTRTSHPGCITKPGIDRPGESLQSYERFSKAARAFYSSGEAVPLHPPKTDLTIFSFLLIWRFASYGNFNVLFSLTRWYLWCMYWPLGFVFFQVLAQSLSSLSHCPTSPYCFVGVLYLFWMAVFVSSV